MGFFRFHLFTDFIPPHPPFLFSGFCWRHVAPRKSEKTSYASVNFAVQDVFFVELVFPYLLLWGPGPPLRSNEGQTMAFRSKSPSRVEKLAAYQWKLRRRHQCSQKASWAFNNSLSSHVRGWDHYIESEKVLSLPTNKGTKSFQTEHCFSSQLPFASGSHQCSDTLSLGFATTMI